MISVPISEAKAKLSEYLARVEAGEEIEVTKRGVPIARIVSPPRRTSDDMERMRELEKRGVVRLGTGRLPKGFWDEALPFVPGNKAVEALIADREEGR